MKIGKWWSLSVVALVLVLVSYGSLCTAETRRGITSDSIRIGVSAPLTKFLANAGRQTVAALNAYASYINDKGGIHGRKLELVVDDSQLDPSISLGIFKKQVTSDNIFAHISWGTPPSTVLMKPAIEERMPLLILGAAKSFFVPPKKYVFAFLQPYELQAASCVTYIHDALKKKDAKLAVFWRNDDYGKTALIGARAAAKHYKCKIVAEPSYILGQAIDFASEVLKIKRAKADFVLLGSSVADVSGFLREARSQGLKATVIGALGPCSERKIIEQSGDAADKYMAVFSFSMFSETGVPGVKRMLEISKKYAPEDILKEESYYYTLGFYQLEIIVQALQQAGPDLTTDKFIAALQSIKGDPGEGLGPKLAFSSTKHFLSEYSFLAQVDMKIKDFKRVGDWFAPPKPIADQLLQ